MYVWKYVLKPSSGSTWTRFTSNVEDKAHTLGSTPQRCAGHTPAIWDLNQINIQRRRQSTYVGKHPSKVRRPQTCDLKDSAKHIQPQIIRRNSGRRKPNIPNVEDKAHTLGSTPQRCAGLKPAIWNNRSKTNHRWGARDNVRRPDTCDLCIYIYNI